MHKDVLIAAIGNPLAYLAGFNWGIIASVATALYFVTKWLRELWEWHREVKGRRKNQYWGDHH